VPTIAAALALAAVGMTAIASATAQQPGRAGLWQTQLAWLGIASIAAVIVIAVDYHVWAEFSLSLHGLAIGLLVAVLLFGKAVGGNKPHSARPPLNQVRRVSSSNRPTTVAAATATRVLQERERAPIRGVATTSLVMSGTVAWQLPSAIAD
jgi:hypothetical protein